MVIDIIDRSVISPAPETEYLECGFFPTMLTAILHLLPSSPSYVLYLARTEEAKSKTINSRDSLVVTHPTTSLPAYGLSTAERTGSPVFHTLWSIAKGTRLGLLYKGSVFLR